MPLNFLGEEDKVLKFLVKDELKKKELEEMQSISIDAINKHGKIKVFVILEEFKGWERGADWNDVSFAFEHDKEIQKIVIVGEEKWKDDVLIFAGESFRNSPVKYFSKNQLQEASEWIA